MLLEWDGHKPIATNYAFRTEQAGATLRAMGAYVDNVDQDNEIIPCDLTEMY